MKKTVTGALVAGLVGLCLSSAPAAHADASNAAGAVHAAATYFCIYENGDFGGGQFCATPPTSGFKTIGLPGKRWKNTKRSANNAASSMRNGTRCNVWLDDTPYYGTKKYIAKAHSVDKTFKNNGFNDKASQIVFDCPR
ncbi:hypothetical protein GCM10023196_090900 [Actinoallomurus vinaceus]|uniref:Uncharacterized protein n=1 Tax=Actinoallomurus vinaceus TaxID=1080074 RepID=A0ABP8UU78_9ACTN